MTTTTCLAWGAAVGASTLRLRDTLTRGLQLDIRQEISYLNFFLKMCESPGNAVWFCRKLLSKMIVNPNTRTNTRGSVRYSLDNMYLELPCR